MLQGMNVDAMQSGLAEGTEDVEHLHSRIHYLRTGKRTGFRGLRLPFEERVRCISGRKHWKLEYADIRMPMSKTPSDYRSAQNCASDMANRCF